MGSPEVSVHGEIDKALGVADMIARLAPMANANCFFLFKRKMHEGFGMQTMAVNLISGLNLETFDLLICGECH